uniref:G_PROTEIN_RECEP_F1_2 domain-containing protein n=1 Tax=Heterorhabditis bacteriophora TaxID=37862 RepID=A0A1I7X275_HETBA
MVLATYGPVAIIFLIFFNAPYRKFLSEKLREFGKLKNTTHNEGFLQTT